eukprot:COSAG06_NODE_950_length_11350_cov_12.434984_8_plen_287_part_00
MVLLMPALRTPLLLALLLLLPRQLPAARAAGTFARDPHGASGGGWGDGHAAAAAQHHPRRSVSCPRVRLAELAQLPDSPTIVEGVTEGWPAVHRWARPDLLRQHGDARLSAATTPEIAAFGGKYGAELTLRSLVEGFGTAEQEEAATDLFAFDTSAKLLHGHDGGYRATTPSDAVPPDTPPGALAGDFTTPEIFKAFLRDADIGWNTLSLGGVNQGLQFHTHGASWLGLVHGAKEWWIYPPGELPAAVAASMMPLHPASAWAPPLGELLASTEVRSKQSPRRLNVA